MCETPVIDEPKIFSQTEINVLMEKHRRGLQRKVFALQTEVAYLRRQNDILVMTDPATAMIVMALMEHTNV